MLFKDGFVWNRPSGNLVGIKAFEESFNNLDRSWKHSHDAGPMTVVLLENRRASLSFDYIYQNQQCETQALHAKGHYEIICIDDGEEFPRIQNCDLSIVEMIEGGTFNHVLAQNERLCSERLTKAKQ